MTSYVTPKKNTAFVFHVCLEDAANPGKFKASCTLAAGDVLVSTDDGAPGNIATLPTVDADFTKRVKVSLSAGEMNGDNVTIIFSDVAGAEWFDLMVNLQTTARQIDDLSTLGGTAQTGDSYAIVNHADYGNAKLVRSKTPENTLGIGEDGSLNSVRSVSGDVDGNVGGDVKGKVLGAGDGVFVADGVQVASVTALTAQETRDAMKLAPTAGAPATGSIDADLDAIRLITDAIDTSAVTVTSTNDAGVLTITRGVTFAATVSGLTISATWAKLYFTLKESDYDDDDDAIVQIVETNPGAGTDGLLYLDSAAIVSPITIADGTLTVNQAGGTVAIAITDNATVKLAKASGLVWDIKTKDAAGATVENATGTASIVRAITQTI